MITLTQASVIDPYSLSEYPGYDELIQGIESFEKGDLYFSRKFFISSLKKSYRIIFDGDNFVCDGGVSINLHCPWCYDDDEMEDHLADDCFDKYYPVADNVITSIEIRNAIRRYCNFYIGLIHLNCNEIDLANLYLMRSVGFGGEEKQMGDWFFKIINFINPYWLNLTSLTLLSLDNQNSANNYTEYAYSTYWFLSTQGLDYYYWEFTNGKEYRNEKIMNNKNRWLAIQMAQHYNNLSIINFFENEPNRAISFITHINFQYFNNSTLYSNRGMMYFENHDFINALEDFSISINIEPNYPDNYINRALVYLHLGKYNEAIEDYGYAISLDPYNSDYYRLRSLVHFITRSTNECKFDKETARLIDQTFEDNDTNDDNETNSQESIDDKDWLCMIPIKDGGVILSGRKDDTFFARIASKSYIQVLQSFLPFLEMQGR